MSSAAHSPQADKKSERDAAAALERALEAERAAKEKVMEENESLKVDNQRLGDYFVQNKGELLAQEIIMEEVRRENAALRAEVEKQRNLKQAEAECEAARSAMNAAIDRFERARAGQKRAREAMAAAENDGGRR